MMRLVTHPHRCEGERLRISDIRLSVLRSSDPPRASTRIIANAQFRHRLEDRSRRREIETRFDFKGSACSLARKDNELTLEADDRLKMKQIHELIFTHFTRRKLDPGALDFKDPERASGDRLRQIILVKQGVDRELAKKLVKEIKDAKLKVQVSVQGDELRVSGKKRDDLQDAIAHVKAMKIELPLQYVNFRD
jgi:uncharacterized protein YajQ (UPF0234 family)